MQLTTFLTATCTILSLAAASPTENNFSGMDLPFVKRACDCAGVQACCKDCLINQDNGEECCKTTCMDKFPDCYGAC